MDGQYVITDLGKNHFIMNVNTQEELELERYAVWKLSGNVMKEVIEVSNDVEYLKSKYNLNEVFLFRSK